MTKKEIFKIRMYSIICLCVICNLCQAQKYVDMAEKTFLLILELPDNATDEDIILKLNSPNKISAMELITRRNIRAAIPALSVIVENEKEGVLNRSHAARTLLYFGNKNWIQTIRVFCDSYEPKEFDELDAEIHLAGTLAMAGDYSHIDTVLKGIIDKNYIVRIQAVRQLAKYANQDNADVSDIASDRLLDSAENDPNDQVREECLYSMVDMCRKRPDYKSKLIKALNSNVTSKNKKLRELCKEKLENIKKDD